MLSTRRASSRARFALRIDSQAEILAVAHEDIEGLELDIVIVPAGMQRAEIGVACDAENNRFVVEHEALLTDPALRLDDPTYSGWPTGARGRRRAPAGADNRRIRSREPVGTRGRRQ